MRSKSVVVVGMLTLIGWVGIESVADEIRYTGGSGRIEVVRGEITDESDTEVTVKTTSGEQKILIPQIESIRYDKMPPELVTLESRFDQGRFDDIEANMKRLANSADGFVKRELLYQWFRARAQKAFGQPTKENVDVALKLYEAYEKTYNTDYRQYYPMLEQAGRLYILAGNFAQAEKNFRSLGNVNWAGYKTKSQVLSAWASLQQGRASEAILLLDQAIAANETGDVAETERQRAKLYKGEALVATKKFDQAEKILRETLPEISVELKEMKAVGRNALGDALRELGRPKDAILDGYMWVYTLYNTDRAQTARAIYHLSQLFRDDKVRQIQHAEAMVSLLKDKYGDTEWAQKMSK